MNNFWFSHASDLSTGKHAILGVHRREADDAANIDWEGAGEGGGAGRRGHKAPASPVRCAERRLTCLSLLGLGVARTGPARPASAGRAPSSPRRRTPRPPNGTPRHL